MATVYVGTYSIRQVISQEGGVFHKDDLEHGLFVELNGEIQRFSYINGDLDRRILSAIPDVFEGYQGHREIYERGSMNKIIYERLDVGSENVLLHLLLDHQ